MREIQTTEAKARLAHLLSAVERGESFAIARFRARRAGWDRTGVTLEDILAARAGGLAVQGDR